MATVQNLLDVLLLVHGVVSVGFGAVSLIQPTLLSKGAPPPGELAHPLHPTVWHPRPPHAAGRMPGLLMEATFVALEALENIPGGLGALASRGRNEWQKRTGLSGWDRTAASGLGSGSPHAVHGGQLKPEQVPDAQHALWFRLYGLHLLTTGLIATAMALAVHDRQAKLWTARGLWLYLCLAWAVVAADARFGGVAQDSRGAVTILGSLAGMYTLLLMAITVTWPRDHSQAGLFSGSSHVHHQERKEGHKHRHNE